ncbi:MAG TPA: hypothetical protein VFM24_02780 [Nitrospira sp.]|nr:hypothetical protein [Nitrospira sp.]
MPHESGVRVSMDKENNKRDRWLTKEDRGMLRLWLRDLLLFALHTGMRMGQKRKRGYGP